ALLIIAKIAPVSPFSVASGFIIVKVLLVICFILGAKIAWKTLCLKPYLSISKLKVLLPSFMLSIDHIYPLLAEKKSIVVTMHQKPDGDAMGSSLGLYHFLLQQGHQVTVISPTNWASFLNWMPGCKKVLDYERETDKSNKLLSAADFIFCLDFNTLSRTKKMEEVLLNGTVAKVLIDHHQQPQTAVFAYGISDTNKSSTAEMVYDFIINSGHENLLMNSTADCLYAGVMTDTGSFRFPSTSPGVHRMIASLMEKGLKHSKVHEHLFDNYSENRFRFIGNALLNRMEVFYEYNTALIAVPQADLIKYDIKTGDTEGLVNFPLSIQGIKLAAIIIDRGEERKCSFRSKGDFDVNVFARTFFDGGGHVNAAGGQSKESLENVVVLFKKAIKENADKLSTYKF
ncbi:MAG: bifunctional oligoribonuclease/PAP phosphatase NrnA, partial [Ferruginibacter sp.]